MQFKEKDLKITQKVKNPFVVRLRSPPDNQHIRDVIIEECNLKFGVPDVNQDDVDTEY